MVNQLELQYFKDPQRFSVIRNIVSVLHQRLLVKPTPNWTAGICEQVSSRDYRKPYTYPRDILAICFESWEHFSGDRDYPVPLTSKKFRTLQQQYEYAEDNKSLYTRKQKLMRLSLLEHILREMDNVLVRHSEPLSIEPLVL